MLTYPALIEFDHDCFTATFRDFPGRKFSREDAIETEFFARNLLRESIAVCIASRKPVPAPSPPAEGETLIPLPASIAAKVRLHNAMLRRNVTRSDLALRLGESEEYVFDLLDARRLMRTAEVDAAIEAIGESAGGEPVGDYTPSWQSEADLWQPSESESAWPMWKITAEVGALDIQLQRMLDESQTDNAFWFGFAEESARMAKASEDPDDANFLTMKLITDYRLNDRFHARSR